MIDSCKSISAIFPLDSKFVVCVHVFTCYLFLPDFYSYCFYMTFTATCFYLTFTATCSYLTFTATCFFLTFTGQEPLTDTGNPARELVARTARLTLMERKTQQVSTGPLLTHLLEFERMKLSSLLWCFTTTYTSHKSSPICDVAYLL